MSHLLNEVGLKRDPFSPSIADQRDPEDIILEGTKYVGLVKRLVSVIKGIDKNTSGLIFLLGPIGSGKTAIIKRVFYELDGTKLPREENLYIHEINTEESKKVLLFYVRPEQGDPFKSTLRRVAEKCARDILHSGVDTKKLENPDVIANILGRAVNERGAEGIVVFIDQAERLKEFQEPIKELEKGQRVVEGTVAYLREIYNSKNCGFLLVLSSLYSPIFRDLIHYATMYIGHVDPIRLEGIDRSEVETWLEKILEYYRLPGFNPPSKLYPFTKEGINVLLDWLPSDAYIIDRRTLNPRTLYHYLSRLLHEALQRGLIPITAEYALTLLGHIGLLDAEWLSSLNEPAAYFRDAIETFFKILRDYLRELVMGSLRISVVSMMNVKELSRSEYLKELLDMLFEFREGTKLDENLVSAFKKAVDIVVIFRINQIDYVYFVKAYARPKREAIEALDKFFEKVSFVKLGEGVKLQSDNVRFKLIVLNRIPSTIGNFFEILNIKLKKILRIAMPCIVHENDPRSYGALMYLHRKLRESTFTDVFSDESLKDTVHTVFKTIFRELVQE